MKKQILTSDLLLEYVDLGLQTPDLHLLVSAERTLACLVLQGLHCLSRLCNRSGKRRRLSALLSFFLKIKLRKSQYDTFIWMFKKP